MSLLEKEEDGGILEYRVGVEKSIGLEYRTFKMGFLDTWKDGVLGLAS